MTDPNIIRLDEFWPYRVVVLADQIAKRTVRILRHHGDLNLSQWRVLAAVAQDEGCSSADVVAVTPMDKGIVSRAVKTLIDDKLISKRASERDGRVSHLFLTEEGRAQYLAVGAEIRTVDKELCEMMSKSEYGDLDVMLSKLSAVLIK